MICGPSNSGKTLFITKLLLNANDMFTIKPKFILFYYKEWQENYDKIKQIDGCKVTFIKHAPQSVELVLDELKQYPLSSPKICILDDMLAHLSSYLEELFTVVSHHNNCSMVLISQAIFGKKELRNISLQCHYMAIFKSPRDSKQLHYLCHQIEPNRTKYLKSVFSDALKKPFAYVILDFTQQQKDEARYRTNIFKTEWPLKIYPEKGYFF